MALVYLKFMNSLYCSAGCRLSRKDVQWKIYESTGVLAAGRCGVRAGAGYPKSDDESIFGHGEKFPRDLFLLLYVDTVCKGTRCANFTFQAGSVHRSPSKNSSICINISKVASEILLALALVYALRDEKRSYFRCVYSLDGLWDTTTAGGNVLILTGGIRSYSKCRYI